MLFGDSNYIGSSPMSAAYLGSKLVWCPISTDTRSHITRVTTDGGTIPEQAEMSMIVNKLIAASLWNSCVFFSMPSGGVKKDDNQYISKTYDLKTNADLTQTTGTAQPKYSLGNVLYDGGDSLVSGLISSGNAIRETTSNATILVWLKGVPGDSIKYIFSRTNDSAGAFPFAITSGNGSGVYNRLRCFVSPNGFSSSWKNYMSTTDVFDNAWHCIGFTFSPNNLKLYIDGYESLVVKNADFTVNSMFNTDSPIRIGMVSSLYPLLNGSQTSLHQIYNSTFTQEQVLWNYNNIRPIGV